MGATDRPCGLSGSRFELGLGAGFLHRDFAEAGPQFDQPGERWAAWRSQVGSVPPIVDLFQERRETYGLSYFVVCDRVLDAMAPAVRSLVTSAAP